MSALTLSSLFLAYTLTPMVVQALRVERRWTQRENRVLAPRPTWSFQPSAIRRFPRLFDDFYNDQFGLRNALVALNVRLRAGWLHVSPVPRVILGKDGWLFWAGDRDINDYRLVRPFTPEEQAYAVSRFEERWAWATNQGIAYIATIAPDKHTVYPEYIRVNDRPPFQTTRLLQFLKALPPCATAAFVNILPALEEAKQQGPIYYKLDTHWNVRGAFAAYLPLARQLSRRFPAIVVPSTNAFQVRTWPTTSGDIARSAGLAAASEDTVFDIRPRGGYRARSVDLGYSVPAAYQPVAREVSDTRLPRAVIFGDSFMEQMYDLLAEHFRRSVYVRSYNLDPELIAQEQPDVIIVELVERNMHEMISDTQPMVRFARNGGKPKDAPEKEFHVEWVADNFAHGDSMRWECAPGASITGGILRLAASTNTYAVALRPVACLPSNTYCTISLTLRAPSGTLDGIVTLDLFGRDYDDSAQELLVSSNLVTQGWRTVSKIINTAAVPPDVCLRIIAYGRAPVEIARVSVAEERPAGTRAGDIEISQ